MFDSIILPVVIGLVVGSALIISFSALSAREELNLQPRQAVWIAVNTTQCGIESWESLLVESGVRIYDTETTRSLGEDMQVCTACSCPSGSTLYLKVDKSGVPTALQHGFVIQSPTNVPDTTIIRIVKGASLQSNTQFMVPQVATVFIGINNTVMWINEDVVPHTIASDSDYRDPVSGAFLSLARPEEAGGPFVMPEKTFEFTFTQPGRYDYHHEPHPWVTGKIIVLAQ